MDSWLDSNEINDLIKQLNPDLEQGKIYDANWQKLRREQQQKIFYPLDNCVKTQTPTLLDFETNYSFTYRRFDGAHWHTEIRDIDTKFRKQGLTPLQKQLKDNIDTIFALKNFERKPQWITPVDKKTDNYDPRYQMVKIGSVWLCCIDNCLYESSSRRERQDRGYYEIRFSTNRKPLFTKESTDKILDRILK